MSIIIDLIKKIKGKKMKTLIEAPSTGFLESNIVVNESDELKLIGKDGNNVAYDQTIQIQPNTVIFFDNSSRNFVPVQLNGEITDNMLVYKVIRTLA